MLIGSQHLITEASFQRPNPCDTHADAFTNNCPFDDEHAVVCVAKPGLFHFQLYMFLPIGINPRLATAGPCNKELYGVAAFLSSSSKIRFALAKTLASSFAVYLCPYDYSEKHVTCLVVKWT
jgi:hypothetical protein